MKPEQLHRKMQATAQAIGIAAIIAVGAGVALPSVRLISLFVLLGIVLIAVYLMHNIGAQFLVSLNEAVNRARSDLLSTARQQKTLTERIEKLNLVSDLLKSVASSRDLDSMLGTILAKTMQFVGSRSGFVSLLDEASLTLEVASAVALDGNPVQPGKIKLGEGIIGSVAATNQPKLVGPGAAAPVATGRPRVSGNGHSLIAVPLRIEERVIGVLTLEDSLSGEFRQSDIELLNIVGQEIGLAIEKARLYEQMAELSITDAVTGLANRRYLDQRLTEDISRSRRYHLTLSLTIFDLDKFKEVNDTYGHAAGDAVLRQFAEILRSNIRDTDLVARYGGEEFVIVQPDCNAQQAMIIAERIRHIVEEYEFEIPGSKTIRRTVSAGVASIPLDASDANTLVKASDEAMYYAKKHGRNRVILHQELSKENVLN